MPEFNDLPGTVLRGVPRITQHARMRLDEPELTESTVRGWIAYKKLRTRRFGVQITTTTTELDEDLAGLAT